MSGDPSDLFRRWGYLEADLDPLGRLVPFHHPDLDAAGTEGEAARWRAAYCGKIGAEFMHIPYPDRCRFVAERMEAEGKTPDRRRIVRLLAAAEEFERFMHARYVGTKRYSLEGAAALLPLLDSVLESAAGAGAEIALIGMSHRGRLTVMAHIVHVPPENIFAFFEDVDPRSVLGGGDVKYHMGATGRHETADGRLIDIHLVSNPSHLEAVDPVLMGRARSRQARIVERARDKVVPISLHGDAAFAGQGIAAETLNLSALRGYNVGGTVHVVVNNLLGFTTPPEALHSSRYATDVARRLPIPILHVNADDPEAVVRTGRLAMEYRARFHTDVVIDLIGYRKYGHSEVDDPTITQPRLYRDIEKRPMLWRAYAGISGVAPAEIAALEEELRAGFDASQGAGRAMTKMPLLRTMPSYWDPYRGGLYDASLEVPTAADAATLDAVSHAITTTPPGFQVHPKLRKLLAERREMADGKRPVDWAMAEALAFGTLLWSETPVRLSGQDSRRGTFSQRHAVLFEAETGEEYVPLRLLREDQALFEVCDSMLSEAAVLGFEYGFSRDHPEALVAWEAQFGDFANGAQVIIDQFISAAEDKWSLLSGLTMLLPHGYEGQGPEHSSARLERYLQLAAEDNFQICQPSTAAQYFHLLRRQALRGWRKPLVVLTPKSLLRAASAGSRLQDLSSGSFRAVLPDPSAAPASRILVASGKVAHELLAERARRPDAATAIVRLDQLYPFPELELKAEIERHGDAREIIWVQEEPANMGALFFVQPRIERVAGGRRVASVKRSPSASPATGSYKAHAIEQKTLMDVAFSTLRGS